MKRLQININYSEDKNWLGGSIYINNLLKTLASLPIAERPLIHINSHTPLPPETVDRMAENGMDTIRNPNPGLIKRVYHRLPLPESARHMVRKIKRAITQEPNPVLRQVTFPATGAVPCERSNIYWIPDFQHVHLPQYFQESEIAFRNKIHQEISQCDAVLILSSQAAMDDFNTLYPNAQVRSRRWSFCSHLNVNNDTTDFDVRSTYDLPEKFLYVPNQFWAHKDHITVFRALKTLQDRGLRPNVVCTGYQADYRNPLYFQNIMEYVSDAGLDGQIRVLGVVPREHQVEIFRCAAAVIQPSLFEGWSTVIEDAKAIGRPILASDLPVHLEQLEGMDRVWFFKRSASDELADLLEAVWPELTPGPDFVAEAKANECTEARRLVSGREFLRIVAEAADLAYKS